LQNAKTALFKEVFVSPMGPRGRRAISLAVPRMLKNKANVVHMAQKGRDARQRDVPKWQCRVVGVFLTAQKKRAVALKAARNSP
jgi:hypothetical protein